MRANYALTQKKCKYFIQVSTESRDFQETQAGIIRDVDNPTVWDYALVTKTPSRVISQLLEIMGWIQVDQGEAEISVIGAIRPQVYERLHDTCMTV